jgi:ubiquinone/menaquinone biosynthesis C-methylase UbiE
VTKKQDDQSIDNTGERLVPAYSYETLVYGEHVIRYEAARALVKGKKILDIASGTGYGSAILGESASSVLGVDLDAEAVEYATKNYGSKNVKFVSGDGEKIPAEDGSFDAVVSYETIEHIKDYKTFMDEVKRVLKPGGLFILSTPNDLEYPEGNHFHLHEFKPKELQVFVDKYFKHSKCYYQGNWLYNAIVEESLLSKPGTYDLPTMQLAPIPIDKSVYLFLLCSDKPIKETVAPLAAMSEHWSERVKVDRETAEEKQRSEHIRTIRRLEKTIDQKHGELLQAMQERDQYKRTVQKIQSTKAWRALRKSVNLKNQITGGNKK